MTERIGAFPTPQASRWTRDQRVHVTRRQLSYRGWPGLPPFHSLSVTDWDSVTDDWHGRV